MTDGEGERFPTGWLRRLWSREPIDGLGRLSLEEQRFRRELLGLLPRLRGHALALTGAPDRADDLVQDTCERALTRWKQWHGSGALAAWVLRILHNLWRDRLRAEAVRAADPLPDDSGTLADPPRTEDRMELEQTLAAMAALAPDQRATLLLVSVEGLSYREAAEVLEVPIGTVRSRVSRARSALIDMLAGGLEQRR